MCYDKAVKEGIQHGRLPIGDYIKMSTRHVLTVNQVLEIMLRWLEFQDWEKAFMDAIPKRKLPEVQRHKIESNEDPDETEEAMGTKDSHSGSSGSSEADDGQDQ